MPTEVARPLGTAEIEDVARRLVERDPQLDLPRFVPRLIAAIYERDEAVRRAQADAAAARASEVEVTRRLETLNVEITRRDAVIEVARHCRSPARAALETMDKVLVEFDRGDVVISS